MPELLKMGYSIKDLKSGVDAEVRLTRVAIVLTWVHLTRVAVLVKVCLRSEFSLTRVAVVLTWVRV